MIDTHCHLYLEQFQKDIEDVLDRAHKAGLSDIFMPAIDFDSLSKMEHLSHSALSFHRMAGIHPTSVNDGKRTTEEDLHEYGKRKDIVGIGETGLDYYWNDDCKAEQQKSLRIHCNVAKTVNKPIVLHNRDSTKDLLDIIEEQQDGSLTGVWHCFNGSVEEGKRALGLGLHLGIGGIFTFKNADVDKTVAQLPLDNMILETDAPYLAPTPKRGERNEPAFIVHTAKRLAEVKELSVDEVERRTNETARKLFGLTD